MKYKLIIFILILLFTVWLFKPILWLVSPNGSVSTNIIRLAIKNCVLGFSSCTSSLMLKDMTDFQWDTAYLFPHNFFADPSVYSDDQLPKEIYTLDMTQLVFFFKGAEVHREAFCYVSPRFSGITIDIEPCANQMIIFDNHSKQPDNITVERTNSYFKCNKESHIKVLNLIPAKGQWPGKIVLVSPENCEIKQASVRGQVLQNNSS